MDFGAEIDDEAIEALDEPALRRMRAVAWIMDDAVRLPVLDYRIGLDPILGVLPVAGDAVSAVVSVYIVAEAAYLGVPLSTLVRMLAYVAVDATVGSIPVIGSVVDAVLKVNGRNVELTRRELERRRDRTEGDGRDGSESVEITVEER